MDLVIDKIVHRSWLTIITSSSSSLVCGPVYGCCFLLYQSKFLERFPQLDCHARDKMIILVFNSNIRMISCSVPFKSLYQTHY